MAECTKGGKRDRVYLRNVNNGLCHPPKKGVVHTFSFTLSSSELDKNESDYDQYSWDRELKGIYKGYSIGDNNDIVFDVKVITTPVKVSIEIIRVSQNRDTIHLIFCQAVPDYQVFREMFEPYGSEIRRTITELFIFPPTTFRSQEEPGSIIIEKQWIKLPATSTLNVFRYKEPKNILISGSIMYEEPLPSMIQDMTSLLNNEENSDVEICVGGQKKFSAHKLILSSRSSFFKAMFSVAMRESVENIVHLPEDSPEIFEQVLHYIYTDSCPKISETPSDLLILADKYDLQGLRAVCEEEIEKTMNINNVCDYLVKTGMINAKKVYDKCYKFILDESEYVIKTDGWDKLKAMAESQKFLSDIIIDVEGN